MTYDPNPSYPVTDGEVEVGYRPWRRRSHWRKAESSRSTDQRRSPGIASPQGSSKSSSDEASLPSWSTLAAFSLHGTRSSDGRRRASLPIRCSAASSKATSWSSSTSSLVRNRWPCRRRIRPGKRSGRARSPLVRGCSQALGLSAVRSGEAGNLGQSAGETGSEQQLLFVDWPILDRHKQRLLPRIDRYVDLSEPESPRSLVGESLRRTLADLAGARFAPVRPSCRGRGEDSGSATGSGYRPTRRTSRGPTS